MAFGASGSGSAERAFDLIDGAEEEWRVLQVRLRTWLGVARAEHDEPFASERRPVPRKVHLDALRAGLSHSEVQDETAQHGFRWTARVQIATTDSRSVAR